MEEKWRQMAKDRHIALSYSSLSHFGITGLGHLRSLLLEDKDLNQIPLAYFDRLTMLFNSYHASHINQAMTLAEGVCVYKQLLTDMANGT